MTPHHINRKVRATPAVTVKRRLTRRPEGCEPRLRIDMTIHRTRLQAVSTLIQQPWYHTARDEFCQSSSDVADFVGRKHEHRPPKIGRTHVELQSLMRISYAVFCLQQKKKIHTNR